MTSSQKDKFFLKLNQTYYILLERKFNAGNILVRNYRLKMYSIWDIDVQSSENDVIQKLSSNFTVLLHLFPITFVWMKISYWNLGTYPRNYLPKYQQQKIWKNYLVVMETATRGMKITSKYVIFVLFVLFLFQNL